MEDGCFHRGDWVSGSPEPPAPIVLILCKETYSREMIGTLLELVQDFLARALGCDRSKIYAAVQRIPPAELLIRGSIWTGPPESEAGRDIALQPIGIVRSPRVKPEDDDWGGVVSSFEIDDRVPADRVRGLGEFSHLEVVFFLHRGPPEKIRIGARHPRNDPALPSVGMFAQRAKGRPNRLGVSRCRLLAVEGLVLTVEGLDAVDRTPVLDVKPYMTAFGPRGEVREPEWVHEIMARYY